MLDSLFYEQCPQCFQRKLKWVDVIKGETLYKGCSVYQCQDLICQYKETRDGNRVVRKG